MGHIHIQTGRKGLTPRFFAQIEHTDSVNRQLGSPSGVRQHGGESTLKTSKASSPFVASEVLLRPEMHAHHRFCPRLWGRTLG